MPKELERDLGLFAVIAISIGAMVGSGIFILPGLALETAGPAVILAYLLAGVLYSRGPLEVRDGHGDAGGRRDLHLHRARDGPAARDHRRRRYLVLAVVQRSARARRWRPLHAVPVRPPEKPIALGLAAVLIVVNMLGAKQTGRLQVGIVAVMLAALLWFVVGGLPDTTPAYYGGFFDEGSGGLLAATGLVFVSSYAGVTKIASVAEEVENPTGTSRSGYWGR